MKIKNYCFIIISCFIFSFSFSQNKDLGTITGNAESIFQYLNEDTLIGANQPASKGLINSYMIIVI